MGRKKLTAGRDPNLPFVCFVCGDIARGNNFSVLSCVSCKSFFRRHGQLNLEKLQCKHQKNCFVTKETRGNCLPCRLKKCLAVGMDPQMIRCPPVPSRSHRHQDRSTIIIKPKPNPLPSPRTLDLLLRNDRSTLATDQWTLLSNILHCYDQQNVTNRVRNYLNEKSSLPVKLRSKSAETLNLISEPLKCILPMIEHSPHFHHLSIDARQSLKLHNLFFTGAINGYLVARETDAFRNPTYITACTALYGEDYIIKCAQDNQRLETNANLVKLMLFVLIFSSNCSIVFFNGDHNGSEEEERKRISNRIELTAIQDIYVTMLWKYMVYLYGFNQAAVRFSLMIKSVIDMFRRVEELPAQLVFNGLIDKLDPKSDKLVSR